MGKVLKKKFLKVAAKKGLTGKEAETFSIRKAYPKESKGMTDKQAVKRYVGKSKLPKRSFIFKKSKLV